jgi:hypothetical protein
MVLIIALGVQDNPSPIQRWVCITTAAAAATTAAAVVVCCLTDPGVRARRISGVLMVGAVVSPACGFCGRAAKPKLTRLTSARLHRF